MLGPLPEVIPQTLLAPIVTAEAAIVTADAGRAQDTTGAGATRVNGGPAMLTADTSAAWTTAGGGAVNDTGYVAVDATSIA